MCRTRLLVEKPVVGREDGFPERGGAIYDIDEDEFLAAAKQSMVAKVFAAARAPGAALALVDVGLDDIDIGDSASPKRRLTSTKKRTLGRDSRRRDGVGLLGIVRCTLTLEDALRPSQRRRRSCKAHASGGSQVRCTWRRQAPQVATENVSYLWRESLVTYAASTPAGLVAAGQAELACNGKPEEGSNFCSLWGWTRCSIAGRRQSRCGDLWQRRDISEGRYASSGPGDAAADQVRPRTVAGGCDR